MFFQIWRQYTSIKNIFFSISIVCQDFKIILCKTIHVVLRSHLDFYVLVYLGVHLNNIIDYINAINNFIWVTISMKALKYICQWLFFIILFIHFKSSKQCEIRKPLQLHEILSVFENQSSFSKKCCFYICRCNGLW